MALNRTCPPPGATLNRQHPLARGLAGYWPMNEGGGGLVNDLAGTSNGVASAGAKIVAGVSVNGGYVQAPYSRALACVGSAITVWCRFLVQSGTGQAVFGKPFAATHTDPYFDWLIYITSPGSVSPRIGSAVQTGLPLIPYGVPLDVVFTADGTNWLTYYQGRRVAAAANSALPTDTNSRGPRIGANGGGGETLNGRVFAAGVWRRALAASEVAQLYADPYGMVRPARAAWGSRSGLLLRRRRALTSAA